MIEGHGDDIYLYGDKIRHNFSSNIYQCLDHSDLRRYLTTCLNSISNYPQPAPYTVESAISNSIGLPSEYIMVTNGAAEAIHIVARAFQGCRSTILQPTFAEYADACRISGHKISSLGDFDALSGDADLVWICNPNNPTGKVYDRLTILDLIDHHSDKIFVIDQTYHKYTFRQVLLPEDVMCRKNLILLYSMTKDYAIPGLRLGYVVADKDRLASLKYYRVPWSVNSIAIKAAEYLLPKDGVAVDMALLIDEARRVARELQNIGVSVMPSDTNFMLCRLPKGKACDLKDFLVENFGILIRDASNFEGLTSRHFRIAVQTRSENDLLINAISQWMRS